MTTVFFAEGCTAPDKGRLLENYLSSQLSEDQAATFEEHYFACSACLEAIRVRQIGPHAVAHLNQFAPGWLRFRWGLVGAALAVVAALYAVCSSGALKM